VQYGRSANLPDPGCYDTKNKSDLLHGRFLVVIKGQDQTLTFGQVVDCLGQTLPHLPIQVVKERIVVGSARYKVKLFLI